MDGIIINPKSNSVQSLDEIPTTFVYPFPYLQHSHLLGILVDTLFLRLWEKAFRKCVGLRVVLTRVVHCCEQVLLRSLCNNLTMEQRFKSSSVLSIVRHLMPLGTADTEFPLQTHASGCSTFFSTTWLGTTLAPTPKCKIADSSSLPRLIDRGWS